jgi:alanine racemase
MRPTWVEVSLSALRRNFRAIQNHVGPDVSVCAVVKAHAYGHGLVECARALSSAGATWFGVTSTEEGMALRQSGVEGRILLLTGFWRGEEEDLIKHQLTPAVWDWWHLGALEGVTERMQVTQPLPVHMKLDTGMARLGVCPEWHNLFMRRIKAAPRLQVEGVFTHLASSEVIGAPDVDAQVSRFEQAICAVRREGLNPSYYHMANTSAIASRPHTWKNMVRPGLGLYGYTLPFTSHNGAELPQGFEVEPVLTWKARVVSLRWVPAGQGVGYNGAYITERGTQIAVLPVGYADGLRRDLSLRGRVIIRDHYAPILGKVAMDLTLVDVTDIPGVTIGDEVLVIGASEHCRIDAWEHARLSNTIPYEILCDIGKRVPRKYV